MPTNYVSSISKNNFMLMNNLKTIKISEHINSKPISKQSNLKYLDITFDNKLNWKPQIKKLAT